MKFYTEQHRYYCGVDLHARSKYVCVLDQAGDKVVYRNIPTEPEPLLRLLKPYRRDVAAEMGARGRAGGARKLTPKREPIYDQPSFTNSLALS